MLRLTVEIVPFGFESAKRTLYEMEIVNIGEEGVTYTKAGEPRFSYKVRTRNPGDSKPEKIDHGVMVKGFDRKKPLTELLKLILKKFNKKGEIEK